MHILYVTLRLPFPPTSGHRLRIWLLLRALAAEQHDITLLSLTDDDDRDADLEPVKQLCRSVAVVPREHTSYESRNYLKLAAAMFSPRPYQVLEVVSPQLRARVEEHLARNKVDLIICDQAVMAVNLPRKLSVPIVMDSNYVAHELLGRYMAHMRNPAKYLYLGLERLKMRPWEARVCSEMSVMACSDLESRSFEKLGPKVRAFTVPNVVDVDEYSAIPGGGDASTLLFSGTMEWYPNQNGVEFFASEVLPELRRLHPGVRLRAAGRGGAESFRSRFRDKPEIEFTGFVPDMKAELANAAICIVPLRIGSGTRLKILEAGAMSRPVVSTRLGAEGLDFVEGSEIVLADDGREFARAVASLLADPARRRTMGEAARKRVEKQYSLNALRESLRCMFDGLGIGKTSLAPMGAAHSRSTATIPVAKQ